MRNLSDKEAERILAQCGIKAPDVGGILWHRILNAVQLAYRLGHDADTMKFTPPKGDAPS